MGVSMRGIELFKPDIIFIVQVEFPCGPTLVTGFRKQIGPRRVLVGPYRGIAVRAGIRSIDTGHHARTRRRAHRITAVIILKDHTLLCKLVQIGGFDKGMTTVSGVFIAVLIAADKDDIRSFSALSFGHCRRKRCGGRSNTQSHAFVKFSSAHLRHTLPL